MSMKRDLYKGARRTAVRRRLTAVLAAAGLLAAPAAFPAAVPAAADRLVTGPAASDAKDDLSAAVSAADDTASVPAAGGAETAKWAVYVYLCGSDLESEHGAATGDFSEILEAQLPADVQVVVETGGASSWQNDVVDPDYLERYLITAEDASCVDRQPLANMGESATFADFLTFCRTEYPAEKEAVILWNHGGGSADGVAFDELYNYDNLTLGEMKEAFQSVCQEDEADPPFEMVGFDACLMATIDTANMLRGVSSYMVASEEMEPGCGWAYTSFLTALGEDPDMDGSALGRVICDSFLAGCREYGDYEHCTLSLVDLKEAGALVDAYDTMGAEALVSACADAAFMAEFGRGAEDAENYGGNTMSAGYANMVDLGDLAAKSEALLPESAGAIFDALNNCVLYKVSGNYRSAATGLSCYYSYDGDQDNYNIWASACASESFSAYYTYMLTGTMDEELGTYISDELGYTGDWAEPDTIAVAFGDDRELPVSIDDEGYVAMKLDAALMDALTSVTFELVMYDEEEDFMIYLGTDNDIEGDWDSGVFRDNFRNVWGSLDGHLCHMEVIYTNDDYTFYNVPILLNGEEYQLKVVYDSGDGEYHILGANQGIEDNGMADKNTVSLTEGDVITTLHYASSMSGDEELSLYPLDEFTVTDETSFREEDLGDGTYMLMFRVEDAQSSALYSQPAYLSVTGDEAEVSLEAV